MGRTLLDLERPLDASSAFEQALRIVDETGVGASRLDALQGLALAAMETGDFARADSLLSHVLHLVEAERAVVTAGNEAGRSEFWYPHYLARVGLYLRQGRVEDAFLALDQARARVLRDLRRHRFDRLSGEAQAASDSLAALLGDLHGRLAASGLGRAEALKLRARVGELEAERAALYGEPARLGHVTIDRLQTALAARGQVLIAYYFEAPAHAFVLRADTLLAVPLGEEASYDRIRTLLASVSPQWGRAEGPIDVASATFELGPLHDLYEVLFAPVAAHVPAGQPLVVVPEGPIAQFPFGLLIERPPERFQFATAPYLLRRHPISTELAAALLLDPTPAGEATKSASIVAFGRSEFAGVEVDSPLRSAYGNAAPPDLPSVSRELQSFGRRFPSALVALDGTATESAFYDAAGKAGLLHLASHAFVAESDPLNSFVQLVPDAVEDGRLHLFELLNRPLTASLVVLSGCRTARGRDLLGEGTLGLHYAVRAAGAESSLGTLWQVDDAATVDVMDAFYAGLARGQRKDVALQRAQLLYLERHDGLRNSPFFWAAPVLYGDPAPVALPPSRGGWWWAFGIGLLLVAFALPVFRQRFAAP